MSDRFESSFRGVGDAEIFFQIWKVPNPRGTIVVTHGLAEHSECYHPFGQVLNKFGWDVVAWDLRGHGRSEGKRGYVADFTEFERDLATLLQTLREEDFRRQIPFVLFGHSMGGLVVLKTVLSQGDFGAAAVCLSSPALGLAVKVPKAKEIAARWAARWAPGITMWNEIRYEDLSRDEDMIRQYPNDPLRHDKVSPRIYTGMVEGFEMVHRRASEIKAPFLLQLAGIDRVVSTPASMEFFERVGSSLKEIHIYTESFHEIFNDLDRDRVFQDMKTFLNQLK